MPGIDFSENEASFILSNTGCQVSELEIKSINTFHRITLVNKNFQERCTIDLNLTFLSDMENIELNNLVIIELKQGVRNMRLTLREALKKNHIYEKGFSKYCVGRAIAEPGLKRNQFKPRLLEIERSYSPIAVTI